MDDEIVLPYKGQTVEDTAAVYCPYIPLQVGVSFSKWYKSDIIDKNNGWAVYSVDKEIEAWIAIQPYDLWNIYPGTPDANVYSLSPEVESWFLLRWS